MQNEKQTKLSRKEMKKFSIKAEGAKAKLFTALTVVIATLFSFGCSKSDEADNGGSGNSNPSGVTITVETSGAEIIPESGKTEITFKVSPANTDFTYSNGSYNVRLFLASNKAIPKDLYLSDIISTGAKGTYRATINDRSGGKKIQYNICIGITLSGSSTVCYSNVFSVQNYEMQMGISAISFLKQENPELEEDIYCSFDEATHTYTGRSKKVIGGLVDPTKLVATFVALGEVKVGGKAQQSGVTPNDFSQPVTYTVTHEGQKKEYKVNFVNFTGLPVVYVNTATKQYPINRDITSKTEWKDGQLRIEGNGAFDDLDRVDMQLRGRGNVTWGWDKKAFNVKFDKQQKVLGMPKHKRWIMLANYADNTMLRNDVAYNISGMTSLKWAPRGQHVELVYNGVYSGTYYLCEQVRVDKDRVAITELPKNADGTTNSDVLPTNVGYLVEFDFHADETPWQWATSFHHTKFGKESIYLVKYPDEDELTKDQFNYIKGLINDWETKLQTIKEDASATEASINKQYEDIINKYVDPMSFIDYWLIYEVCINHEILNPGSVYLHKDAGGKFFAGPTWDFDYGTFNFTYGEAQPAQSSLYVSGAIWYRYLFRNPKMKAMAKARWEELKPQLKQIPDYITQKAEYLKYAAKENYAVWPMTITTNGDSHLTYEESIKAMKDVFNRRMQIIEGCMETW